MTEENFNEYDDLELLIFTSMSNTDPSPAIDAFNIFLSRHSNAISNICNVMVKGIKSKYNLHLLVLNNTIYQLFHKSNDIIYSIENNEIKQIIYWVISNELGKLICSQEINYIENITNSTQTSCIKGTITQKQLNTFFSKLTTKESCILQIYILFLRFCKHNDIALDLNDIAKFCLTTKVNVIATLSRIKKKIISNFNYKINDMNLDEIILQDWNTPLLSSGNSIPFSKEEIQIFEKNIEIYKTQSKEILDLLDVLSHGELKLRDKLPQDLEVKLVARGTEGFLDKKLKDEILSTLREIRSRNEEDN